MKQMYKWMFCLAAAIPVAAADWPQWGQTNSRNMVTTEKNLPTDFTPGKPLADGSAIDPATSKNIKWTARLGDQTYGNPTISGGKIFIGTNNAHPRNQNRAGDYAVLMCFDQATGKFIWQLTSPKLAAGKAVDWENIGLCSSPTVDGDRVYIVTNRCEVICVTTNGLAKENVGPFVDEAKFIKNDPPTNTGEAPPDETNLKLDPATDADIVWRYDMRDELGIFPHNMTASSILVVGDKIFVTTSNGVDWSNKHAPAPKSPALVCLDKKTGKYIGEEKSGISARTFKSNWSSPASGKIKTDAGEKEIIIFGGGDGYCYGFDPTPVDGTLKELWRCDCNPPSRKMKDDKPLKYGTDKGPSEIISTPVIVDGKVYVATGQDPEAGNGMGALTCIDATKTGDITTTGKIWTYEAINRSISTASVVDGLVYVADFVGIIHCVDAGTGQLQWTHDTEGTTWGSTMVGDGKIYIGNEPGILSILTQGKELKPIATIPFDGPIYGSPLVVDGVMYIATDKWLYAIQTK